MTPRTRDSDTERRILDAARRVFIRHGTAGARMQEIAEEAGVNQALLHYYFQSKDALAATVFREAASRLLPAAIATLGSEVPLEEKITRFVHLYIDTVRQTPFLPGYVLAELHHHPERLAAMLPGSVPIPALVEHAVLGRLRAQLDAEAAAGRIRRIAPEQFLANLLGLAVVPFITRPAMRIALDMDDDAFARFLDERRAELPGFILNALRP